MPGPRPTETYKCQNRGCQIGGSFEAAPRAWFRDKGLSDPSNCPSCKQWKDSQADEDVACAACGFSRRIPAGVKQMHHKNVGAWESPEYCRRCEEDPEWRERGLRRARRLALRALRDQALQRERARHRTVDALDGLGTAMRAQGLAGRPSKPFAISRSIEAYRASGGGRVASRATHLLALEANDGTGGHREALERAAGTTTDQGLLDYMADLAYNTQHNEVLEFWEGDATAIKVDRRSGFMLAINAWPQRAHGMSTLLPRTGFFPTSPQFQRNLQQGREDYPPWTDA
jgi:hypothetical protein